MSITAMKQALETVASALPAYIDGVAAREYLHTIHKYIEQAEQAQLVECMCGLCKLNTKQPLTDEQADELVRRFARYELLRAVEAAHGIGEKA